jgi:multidrug efflux pump subunit AcrA (membrane-fusion protein)
MKDVMGSDWRPPPKMRREAKTVQEKIEETKQGIAALDVLRKKLRISTTLTRIAIRRFYSNAIAQAAEERKILCASFYHEMRSFEDDYEGLEKELADTYVQLAKLQERREQLAEELNTAQRQTSKEQHLKTLQLRRYYIMQNELRELPHVDEVNTTTILKRMSEAEDELAQLVGEADLIEEVIQYKVREPMAAVDRSRRRIEKLKVEEMELRKQFKPPKPPVDQIDELRWENEQLVRENLELRRRTAELQQKLAELPPSDAAIIDQLTQPETRESKSRHDVRLVIPGLWQRSHRQPGSARSKRMFE